MGVNGEELYLFHAEDMKGDTASRLSLIMEMPRNDQPAWKGDILSLCQLVA